MCEKRLNRVVSVEMTVRMIDVDFKTDTVSPQDLIANFGLFDAEIKIRADMKTLDELAQFLHEKVTNKD